MYLPSWQSLTIEESISQAFRFPLGSGTGGGGGVGWSKFWLANHSLLFQIRHSSSRASHWLHILNGPFQPKSVISSSSIFEGKQVLWDSPWTSGNSGNRCRHRLCSNFGGSCHDQMWVHTSSICQGQLGFWDFNMSYLLILKVWTSPIIYTISHSLLQIKTQCGFPLWLNIPWLLVYGAPLLFNIIVGWVHISWLMSISHSRVW